MNTTMDPIAYLIADHAAAKIKAAKAELADAMKIRRAAEHQAEAAREGESIAAGRVAIAIAEAIQLGADPVLVLPTEMLDACTGSPWTLVIESPAALSTIRMGNSLSTTGSRFPGWMKITVNEIRVRYMPTPLWMEWSKAEDARRQSAKNAAASA